MTKIMSLLIGCSLALAVSAQAEEQNQEKKPVQKSKAVPKQQHTVTNTHAQGAHTQHAPNTNAKIQNPNITKQRHPSSSVQSKKPPVIQSKKAPVVQSKKPPVIQSKKAPVVQSKKPPVIQSKRAPVVQSKKPPVIQSKRAPVVQTNKLPAAQSKKLPAVQIDKNKVQTIRAQHVNFHAKPKPAIASAQFNQHYRIRGAESWHGAQYEVFRSYHPQWHDRGWWHSRHHHILLIGGGWYFWNAGYWFPAWGYDASAAYYPYDGPIYVGATARPFDQVVADAQSILQERGYYRGQVDGLVGPLTQEALVAYQRDQGLEQTAAIDEPTLNALGLT
jgi:hypothetical protein